MFPALTDALRQRLRTAGPAYRKGWRNFSGQTHTTEHRRSEAGHEPRRRCQAVTESSTILTERGTDGLTADRHALRGIRDMYCGMTMSNFYWLSGCVIWTVNVGSVQVCQDITELDTGEINCDDVRWQWGSGRTGRAPRTLVAVCISRDPALPVTSPCVRMIELLFRRTAYRNIT